MLQTRNQLAWFCELVFCCSAWRLVSYAHWVCLVSARVGVLRVPWCPSDDMCSGRMSVNYMERILLVSYALHHTNFGCTIERKKLENLPRMNTVKWTWYERTSDNLDSNLLWIKKKLNRHIRSFQREFNTWFVGVRRLLFVCTEKTQLSSFHSEQIFRFSGFPCVVFSKNYLKLFRNCRKQWCQELRRECVRTTSGRTLLHRHAYWTQVQTRYVLHSEQNCHLVPQRDRKRDFVWWFRYVSYTRTQVHMSAYLFVRICLYVTYINRILTNEGVTTFWPKMQSVPWRGDDRSPHTIWFFGNFIFLSAKEK